MVFKLPFVVLRRCLSISSLSLNRATLSIHNVLPATKKIYAPRLLQPVFTLEPCSRSIKSGLTPQTIEERVFAVCCGFDKIPADKLTSDSKFLDLGLDSLDHIEVIMEIENEFWLEIPDVEAEKLVTPRAIIEYICTMAAKALPIE